MPEGFLTFFVVVAVGVGSLALLRFVLHRTDERAAFRTQLILLGATFVTAFAVLLSLPIESEIRGQVVGLAGVLLSAAIALSATTLLGNALAGMMLRLIRNFGSGDWIRVGEHFGRVTERELLHTEIQTEDRDLVTLPNLMLVTEPVKVIRRSGTVVTARVSLGYDAPHERVTALLTEAAGNAGLEEGFVQVLELGDFSITYRVGGLLREVDRLLSNRSQLRRHMIDALHAAEIEIVSPTFMNQRRVEAPVLSAPSATPDTGASGAEDLAFDKAEAARRLEHLRSELAELEKRIEDADADSKAVLEGERERLASEFEALEKEIDREVPRPPA